MGISKGCKRKISSVGGVLETVKQAKSHEVFVEQLNGHYTVFHLNQTGRKNLKLLWPRQIWLFYWCTQVKAAL